MNRRYLYVVSIALMLLTPCCRKAQDNAREDTTTDIAELDTAVPLNDTTIVPSDTVAVADFTEPEYADGVIPSIRAASPEYADKLAQEGQDGFIIVDKARMKVILYDAYGIPVKTYGMACARKYGDKHKKADSRTPEGYFHVKGVYDSTDWLFTDDNGKTSKVKGQFGPRFIRLDIPVTTQIGIHGTRAPWSIGHRVSHGCIRITNENIMELVDLVHTGMPVIVIPGKRDRAVNREEGHETVYFATAPGFELGASEPKAEVNRKPDTTESAADSLKSVNQNAGEITDPDTLPQRPASNVNTTDSVPNQYF